MRALGVVGLVLLGVGPAWSQSYDISWWTVDAGGSMGGVGGQYVLDSTSGQPDAGGPFAGNPYLLHSGFWAIAAGVSGGPQADLSVTKTDGQATAVPGQPVTYTILATNLGPDPVTGATVLDTPVAVLTNATWTCVASAGSTCMASGNGSISDSVNLLLNGTATYTLTASIDPAATGTLDNTATIAVPPGATDPSPGNNSATDTDALTPQADLMLVKSDSLDPTPPYVPITYTLQVTNLGPSWSTGNTVSDTLPPEVLYISSPSGCTHASGTVTCTMGALAPSSSFAVTFDVFENAPPTLLSNTATVAGNEPDPVQGNDSDTETTTVRVFAEGELVHGSTQWADLESAGGVADEDLYRFSQKPYSSYEVLVDGTSGDIGTGQGPLLERLSSDGSNALQGSAPAGAGSSRVLRWENDTGSVIEDQYIRVRSLGCSTACGPEDVYRIRSWDTTLGVARFNNSATQVTVLVLQNTAEVTVTGHAYFWNTAGTLVGTQAFSMGPHAAFVVNTSTIPGVAGVGGTVTVSHDGLYATVVGKAVAVEPATGFTFDTALEPRRR